MIGLEIAVGVLFVLNIGLVLVVLALARQVGVLFERVTPVGALTLDHGPKIGGAAPRLRLASLDGEVITVGAAGGRSQLLFFLSPTCPVCKKLLPALRTLAAAEGARLQIVLASDGETEEHRAFWQREKLGLPYVLSEELGLSFQIGRLPYAVVIGADGTVRSKGLVNNREQIESLLRADEMGVATMQDFLKLQQEAVG
jgi:methylamine dehydrogenase accessory protein MauD